MGEQPQVMLPLSRAMPADGTLGDAVPGLCRGIQHGVSARRACEAGQLHQDFPRVGQCCDLECADKEAAIPTATFLERQVTTGCCRSAYCLGWTIDSLLVGLVVGVSSCEWGRESPNIQRENACIGNMQTRYPSQSCA